MTKKEFETNEKSKEKQKKQIKFDILLAFWLAIYKDKADIALYFFKKEDLLRKIIQNLRKQHKTWLLNESKDDIMSSATP